jgi:hypothetical protein
VTDRDDELSGPAKAKTIEYISRKTAYRELRIVSAHLESGMISGTSSVFTFILLYRGLMLAVPFPGLHIIWPLESHIFHLLSRHIAPQHGQRPMGIPSPLVHHVPFLKSDPTCRNIRQFGLDDWSSIRE